MLSVTEKCSNYNDNTHKIPVPLPEVLPTTKRVAVNGSVSDVVLFGELDRNLVNFGEVIEICHEEHDRGGLE